MDKNILYKFFEGIASKEERLIVGNWLKEDPGNEEHLMKERAFFDAVILSPSSVKRGGDINRRKGRKPVRYRSLFSDLLKIAAAVAIVVTCGIYFYSGKMKEIQAATTTVLVPDGQRVNLVLPDGTNVWLNARSELQYPSFFTGSNREIKLNGEAYFEVQYNKEKPFIVYTEKYNIEVLGTKFNVEAYNDSDDFSTALMEGSVKVISKEEPANPLLLSPNYKAEVHNGQLTANPIEDYDLYRWREGLICFKNTDFEELMQRFEKCYGIRIIIENTGLSHHSFSGKFRISDGVDNALRVLQRDADYTFTRNIDDSIIYIQ